MVAMNPSTRSGWPTRSGWFESLESRVFLSAVIEGTASVPVGTHTLQPNTPGQRVQIFVTGGLAVQGMNFNAQIADGGPELGGSIDGPDITGVDVLAGTIFANNNTGQQNPGSFSQLGIRYTTTNTGTVNASGLLGTITIDTTGFSSGGFDLRLDNTLNGDTDFAGLPINITNGRINVGSGGSTGSIAGNVYNDLNANGVKNTGEGNLTNWRVFIDANGNNAFDSTERNDFTDGSGNYGLTGLPAGTFRVIAAKPSGWTRVNPSLAHTVTLTAGQTVTGRNFGLTQQAASGSIAGTVFNDADGDYAFDANERNVLTDGSGNYRLASLSAGTFRVLAAKPASWARTAPSLAHTVTLAAGQSVTGRNFGLRQV